MSNPRIIPDTQTCWYTIHDDYRYAHEGEMIHAIGFGVESDLLNPGCDAVQILTTDDRVLTYDHDQKHAWPHPVRRLHHAHQGWVNYGKA